MIVETGDMWGIMVLLNMGLSVWLGTMVAEFVKTYRSDEPNRGMIYGRLSLWGLVWLLVMSATMFFAYHGSVHDAGYKTMNNTLSLSLSIIINAVTTLLFVVAGALAWALETRTKGRRSDSTTTPAQSTGGPAKQATIISEYTSDQRQLKTWVDTHGALVCHDGRHAVELLSPQDGRDLVDALQHIDFTQMDEQTRGNFRVVWLKKSLQLTMEDISMGNASVIIDEDLWWQWQKDLCAWTESTTIDRPSATPIVTVPLHTPKTEQDFRQTFGQRRS